jgi:hypothetical protein
MMSGAKIETACALALAGFALSGPAAAAVVYNNGSPPPPYYGGREVTRFLIAEDFEFTATQVLDGAGIYIGGVDTWDGTFEYFIYSGTMLPPPSHEAFPGEIVQSGEGGIVSVTDSGIPFCTCRDGNAHLIEFEFATSFVAAAGETYWLGIHLAPDFSSRDEVYWMQTNAIFTDGAFSHSAYARTPPGSEWVSAAAQLAFFLTTAPAPEPAGMLLLGPAVGLLCCARARTRHRRELRSGSDVQ